MEPVVNDIIEAIGWSILHSLWQGAIIYVLLFLSQMALPKMSAILKHNLATGSLVLMFFCFCATFLLALETNSSMNLSIGNIEINQTNDAKLVVAENSLNLKIETYFPVVACMYTLGLAFQVIVLLSGYLRLKKIKSVGNLQVPTIWDTVFEAALKQLHLNKKIGFYLSTKVNVPLVIGFFKPVVLFPVALATQLDIEQVEAILIHELAHIRRNDYLINLLNTCIETLLFFNPFVWLTAKLIHIEREHACDDLVIKFTRRPLTYAHALLNLEQLKGKQTPALSLAATGKSHHLYQRIKRITNMKPNYFNPKHQFLILTLTIVTISSLAWINPLKKDEVKENIPVNFIPSNAAKLNPLIKTDRELTKKKGHLEMNAKASKSGIPNPDLPKEMALAFDSHLVPSDTYSSIPEQPEPINGIQSDRMLGQKPAEAFDESTKDLDDTTKKVRKKLNMVINMGNGKQITYVDELPDSLLQQIKEFGKRANMGEFNTLFSKLKLDAPRKTFSNQKFFSSMTKQK